MGVFILPCGLHTALVWYDRDDEVPIPRTVLS
jgi:hypothetical protein